MEKIAVIGLSCLFPGGDTPQQFWQHLLAGDDLTSMATAEQMGVDPHIFYDSEKGQADKLYYLRGGYIRGFEFDATGYRVAPEFLSGLDDLFQWSLHVAKAALHDSGYLDQASVLARCGVMLGNLSFPTKSSYQLLAPLYQQTLEPALQQLLGQANLHLPDVRPGNSVSVHNAFVAGYPTALIAQALALGGMHFALDAACASSLYAVKLACHYLQSHQADLMLAGGVSCADSLYLATGFSNFQAYPEDDQSRPLDRRSGGLTTGEGAGMLVLKRYADAVRDGDRIYATIRGVGASNDGRGKHLLTPNSKGQVLALQRAYADAGVDPATVDYIECHATGTPVGDIVELNSMEAFFGPHGTAPLIGSVKSNLGHLLTAAGMAGMIKTILSLVQEEIPATIHVNEPLHSQNNGITGAQIVRTHRPWPQGSHLPRAAVSAFGFGGNNAHVILEREEQPQPVETDSLAPSLQPQKLAIVGMDAFFGGSRGLDAFAHTIYDGKQEFIPVPSQRWQGVDEQPALLRQYGVLENAPAGAYIDTFEIDALHSRIPPNEAEHLNPQQLLMLKVADNALRDAELEAGGNVAVIIAMGPELSLHRFLARYHLSWQIRDSLENAHLALPPEALAELESLAKESIHPTIETNEYVSAIGSVMANRISSLWDFSGPSFTLSAEENSAFKALDAAHMLLAAGEVDAVLVGAVDLAGGMENVLLRNQIAAVNRGEETLSYDQNSQGWLVGEGAGAVVLKRYDQAQTEQARIYATIDAISIEHGPQGRTTEQTLFPVASAETVQRACQRALAAAGLEPNDVRYLEMSGSGIPWEDEAELAGLLQGYRSAERLHCAVGSVKANIGHTYAASGIASLIKTALCLYHRYIPATPGWSAPKALEQWQESPFYIATQSEPWFLHAQDAKRVGAISGLGMDGACAHIILAEGDEHTEHPNHYLSQAPLHLFPIVGADPDALLARLDQLQQQVASGASLAATAYQCFVASQQQPDAPYALAILAQNETEFTQEVQLIRTGIPRALGQQNEWKTPRGSYFTARPLGRGGKVAFVYPGAFTSYIGMERDMLHLFPQIYAQSADLTSDLSFGLEQYFYPRSLTRLTTAEIEQHEAQLVQDAAAMLKAGTIAAFEYTLILRDYFRLQPAAAFGYSLGEFSMQFALGIWTSVDEACEDLHNSPLFTERLSGPKNAVREYFGLPPASAADANGAASDLWSTYVLLATPDAVYAALQGAERVYLTHINAPGEVVIAGDKQGCRNVIRVLGCDAFRAPFTDVLHCEVMRSEYDTFTKLFDLPVQHVPDHTLYSAADYAPLAVERQTIGPSIAKALCKPLDFPQLVQHVYADGARIFIELGPGGTCSRWIEETLRDKDHVAMPINQRGMGNHSAILKVLARLFSHRVALDLAPLYAQPAQPPATAIIKTVTPGERPMSETLLTEENRHKFRPLVAPRLNGSGQEQMPPAAENSTPPTPQPRPALVGSERTAISHVGTESLSSQQLREHLARVEQAHATFLETRLAALQQMSEMIQLQQRVAQRMLDAGATLQAPLLEAAPVPVTTPGTAVERVTAPQPSPQFASTPPAPPVRERSKRSDALFDEADMLELANGSLAAVFGEEYAIIDTYKRRVRLPGPPYLFVSRITKLDAERGRFEPCSIQTEYDVPHDAWYAVDGQMPSTVVIEASQGNLILASYLGVDFENRGQRVYRALDGRMTFLDRMPRAGETLICDVSLDSFAKNGDTRIFFYTYNCAARELSGRVRPVLAMKGIAGFFDDEQLNQGKGVADEKSRLPKSETPPEPFTPPLRCAQTSFDEHHIRALEVGDLASCFGAAYAQPGRNPALYLPPPVLRLIDRVTFVDPTGGQQGLGLVEAEKDLQLDAWYFQCHFKNDLCLPGTVVGEGCSQVLQFYLLYLGMQTHTTGARFQPIPGVEMIGQSRGQIAPQLGTLSYRLTVTDVGLSPRPFAIGDIDVMFNGKIVARCKQLGLQLLED